MANNCRNCGAELARGALSCAVCGTPVDTAAQGGATQQAAPPPPAAQQPQPQWQTPAPSAPGAPTSDERNWGMFTHLSALVMLIGLPSIVGPLVIWLVKRNDSSYVDYHGKEAVNFNISILIYFVAGGVITVVGAIITLGFGLLLLIPALFALGIAWLVFVVIAGIKASQGEAYRYPLTIRFIS